MSPLRSSFADALRGFALIGICVVNLPFMAAAFDPTRAPESAGGWIAQTIVAGLFEAKFFVLFSLLFGFGFARQLERIESGGATAASYARRLIGLGLFGVAHAILLFPGDILLTYAILGACLWPLRHASDRALLRIAVASVPVAALGFVTLAIALSSLADLGLYDTAAHVAAYRGTLAETLSYRVAEYPSGFVFAMLFNWPLAFGAFCFGLVAGRRGWLDDPLRIVKSLHPWMPLLLTLALVGNGLYAFFPLMGDAALLGFVTLAFGGPALSALYVYALAFLWNRDGGRAMLQPLTAAGRMSLTNYLGQSLLANILFMGWGFGLFDTLGQDVILMLALLNALALIVASQMWLAVFRMGPDEWLLRSWTALRWQRLRREALPASAPVSVK